MRIHSLAVGSPLTKRFEQDARTQSPISAHGRRPSINSIHPFKSATVSSSPSSASFRGPSLLAQAAQTPASSFSPSSSSPFVPMSTTTSSSPFPTISEKSSSNIFVETSPTNAPVPPQAIPRHSDSPDRPVASTRYSSSFSNRPMSLVTGGFSSGSSGPSSIPASGGRLSLGAGSAPRDYLMRASTSASNEVSMFSSNIYRLRLT